MLDREKVFRGLECCRNFNPPDDGDCPEECPYSIESNPHRYCRFNPLLDDVIALLEEQEPVAPIADRLVCGNCYEDLYVGYNYCPHCGRKVKWDE